MLLGLACGCRAVRQVLRITLSKIIWTYTHCTSTAILSPRQEKFGLWGFLPIHIDPLWQLSWQGFVQWATCLQPSQPSWSLPHFLQFRVTLFFFSCSGPSSPLVEAIAAILLVWSLVGAIGAVLWLLVEANAVALWPLVEANAPVLPAWPLVEAIAAVLWPLVEAIAAVLPPAAWVWLLAGVLSLAGRCHRYKPLQNHWTYTHCTPAANVSLVSFLVLRRFLCLPAWELWGGCLSSAVRPVLRI